jgi:tryptophan synthase alpha chain
MRAIEETFRSLNGRGEGALIAYVTGGDPKPQLTPKIVKALVNGGVDIVELGIPFSDPIADGPTIQSAVARALKAGTTPKLVLNLAKEVKEECNLPLAILTYYNPIFRMGLRNFFSLAKRCKVDGVIVPDLPVEEAEEYKTVAENYEVDTIFLAAPSTSISRLRKIISYSSGFIYLVSLFGVTGVREQVQDLTVRTINSFLPYVSGRIPLAVGFGISKPDHVKIVLKCGANGAIVGSAFVRIVEENQKNIRKMIKGIEELAHKLKEACINFKE